jgi:hypothetical protein
MFPAQPARAPIRRGGSLPTDTANSVASTGRRLVVRFQNSNHKIARILLGLELLL